MHAADQIISTEQNRSIYARHGVKGEMFGVSYGNLGKLKKRIKTDHDLAVKLWATGNHDARMLATMIADPDRLKSSELEAWVREINSYPIADAFSGVVNKTPFVVTKMRQWTGRKGEWIRSAGWNLVTNLAQDDEALDDSFFEAQLDRIEATIHDAPNRTRYSMNNTLIAIGVRNRNLEKQAIAAARRIGKVEVDHGETGCKTPDAEAYIRKTLEYRAKKHSGGKKLRKTTRG